METHTDNSSYETDDPESNFLKDNSRKKTYEQSGTETEDDMQPRTDGEQHREENCLTEDAWEITVSTELKHNQLGSGTPRRVQLVWNHRNIYPKPFFAFLT